MINDLLEGCALLEYMGNLYEYIGHEKELLLFQCINDDSYIKRTYEQLTIAIKNKIANIVY